MEWVVGGASSIADAVQAMGDRYRSALLPGEFVSLVLLATASLYVRGQHASPLRSLSPSAPPSPSPPPSLPSPLRCVWAIVCATYCIVSEDEGHAHSRLNDEADEGYPAAHAHPTLPPPQRAHSPSSASPDAEARRNRRSSPTSPSCDRAGASGRGGRARDAVRSGGAVGGESESSRLLSGHINSSDGGGGGSGGGDGAGCGGGGGGGGRSGGRAASGSSHDADGRRRRPSSDRLPPPRLKITPPLLQLPPPGSYQDASSSARPPLQPRGIPPKLELPPPGAFACNAPPVPRGKAVTPLALPLREAGDGGGGGGVLPGVPEGYEDGGQLAPRPHLATGSARESSCGTITLTPTLTPIPTASPTASQPRPNRKSPPHPSQPFSQHHPRRAHCKRAEVAGHES